MGRDSNRGQTRLDTRGFWAAVASFGIWGALPLYWRQLRDVPSMEILAHRVWWCFVFLGASIVLTKRAVLLRELFGSWKSGLFVFLKSIVLGFNWFIFVWAVNAGRVVECSLGYYINPLLSVLLALVFLRERMRGMQYTAFFIALAGVLVMTLDYGRFPWVAFLLAFSFGFYGLLKKIAPVDAQVGILAETLFIAPAALAFIVLGKASGTGSIFAGSAGTTLLLVAAGIVTAVPLILFNLAVRKVPFTVVGFIQYLAPTGMLLIGVFAFREPFDMVKLLSFSLIWTALTLFTISEFRRTLD